MEKLVKILWRFNSVALYLIENAFGLHAVRFERFDAKLGLKWFTINFTKLARSTAMIVALCSTTYAVSLQMNGDVPKKYLHQWISLLIVWVLNLLVTLVIYSRQLANGREIDKLNIHFIELADRYRYNSAIKFRQLMRLMVLLTYEAMAISLLWLNMNPMYRSYSSQDWLVSLAVMTPITVCSLTTVRYCVNFFTVSCILNQLNRDLSRRVRQFHRTVQADTANISSNKLTNIELELSDNLNRLIIQYDKLHDVVVAIIEIYSPSILFLLGLDFCQVTFELYNFYCDLSHTAVDDDDLSMVGASLVSALLSFIEIIFLVDGTSKFNEEVDEAVEWVQRIGFNCVDERLGQSITMLSKLLYRAQEDTTSFYCFALDRSFLTTIIAASCSYLILLIQTV